MTTTSSGHWQRKHYNYRITISAFESRLRQRHAVSKLYAINTVCPSHTQLNCVVNLCSTSTSVVKLAAFNSKTVSTGNRQFLIGSILTMSLVDKESDFRLPLLSLAPDIYLLVSAVYLLNWRLAFILTNKVLGGCPITLFIPGIFSIAECHYTKSRLFFSVALQRVGSHRHVVVQE